MLKIFINGNIRKVLKDKRDFMEKKLDVRLTTRKSHIFIESKKDAYSEYVAEKVFTAIGMGFNFDTAMSLLNEDFMFELIDIKKSIKEARFKEAVARVIGKGGKTIHSISNLTGCEILVKENLIGVIGETVSASIAVHALNSLVRGAPYSHVLKFIQENKGKIYELEDLE